MSKYHYSVYVDDNFHYMDESERYKLGEYDDCASAIAACQALIDECLKGARRPFRWFRVLLGLLEGATAAELTDRYFLFGEDPFIITDDPDCKFSARDYARRRIDEICGGGH